MERKNIKKVTLNLTSVECYVLALFIKGMSMPEECSDQDRERLEANVECFLERMDISEFRQYFITLNQTDLTKLEEVEKKLEEISHLVTDPTQEDRAKFIADLMVITRDKK